MDEITEHEVLYWFGWMQHSPTWRKEYELIQRLFTENQTLRKQIKALTTNESTLGRCEAELIHVQAIQE